MPFVPPPTSPSEPPAPPPMVGPLAAALATFDSPEAPASQPDPAAPPDPAPAPKAPAEPPPLPVEAFPVGRCAAITASIDRRPDARDEILRAEELDDATWERLATHWQEAIDKELARHKNALLRAHDAAYVERLEEERGLIAASDYARLAVADEVSEVSKVLSEMEIPAEAWPRIQRVWIAKMAKDPKLGALVRSLIAQET
jgi:hypothetical protein